MLSQVKKEAGAHFTSASRYIKRLTSTPFDGRVNEVLIVHCCYHKVGTVWFQRVLTKIANRYGLVMYAGEQENIPDNADIFLQGHSCLDPSSLRHYRGSHMVRDLRDVIVSGYFYHKWTKEEWVHVAKEEYDGKTYQQHLNSLSQADGISAEIRRFATSTDSDFQNILSWDFDDPNFIEIKYEDIMSNEAEVFERIFNHYGFGSSAISECLSIADSLSFKNVKKSSKEKKKAKSHLRSGKTGEWKDLFGEAQKELFKELLGDALIKLDYESNHDW